MAESKVPPLPRTFLDGRVTLHSGDCLTVLRRLPDVSVDSVVCDPPYGLEFMGKEWDAPWKVRFAEYGMTDSKGRRAGPVHGSKRNPMCGVCKRHKRGSRRCQCSTPQFDEVPADASMAFGNWCEGWARECRRVLKPGGHLVAFGGTRTYHRLACAIEDAGFEIRDQIGWAYGSGFPKSHDVSKGIDRSLGVERTEVIGVRPGHEDFINRTDAHSAGARREGWDRPWKADPEKVKAHHLMTAPATESAAEWQGWGTALKPAWEPIVLARKPLIGTVAENCLRFGTGALNIDGCRIAAADGVPKFTHRREDAANCYGDGKNGSNRTGEMDAITGRWPANLVHDGSEEVLAAFPEAPGQLRAIDDDAPSSKTANVYGERGRRPGGFGNVGADKGDPRPNGTLYGDAGSAARFFYTAKADSEDRLGSKHPTVKPLDLMQWLVRLVTPRGGTCLDPFAGTGTTGEAAWREGMRAILIEREEEYVADIERRMELAANPTKRAAVAKSKNNLDRPEDMPLFQTLKDTTTV